MSSINASLTLLRRPWINPTGSTSLPLPGLPEDELRKLDWQWSGFLTDPMRTVIRTANGVANTQLGYIDFTGQRYDEECLASFRPSITLAVDGSDRRWIAETIQPEGLPGPVWCIFARPRVALYIDQDLGAFLLRLHHHWTQGSASEWLAEISKRAMRVWARQATEVKTTRTWGYRGDFREWVSRLPADARIYDLRAPTDLRGLPYWPAEAPFVMSRCGRLPVFAIHATSAPTITSPAEVQQDWTPETVHPRNI